MPITTPRELVDEFKKSGEFDRLRRELLKEFQRSDAAIRLKEKVEGIARQWLDSEQRQYMSQEHVHKSLMQEVDRYPVVERAAADMQSVTDDSFSSAVRRSLQKILREDRGEKVDDSEVSQQQEPSKEASVGADTPKVASSDVNSSTTNGPPEAEPEAAATIAVPTSGSSEPLPINIVPPSPDLLSSHSAFQGEVMINPPLIADASPAANQSESPAAAVPISNEPAGDQTPTAVTANTEVVTTVLPLDSLSSSVKDNQASPVDPGKPH
ncbi:hypothetical protein AB1N83_002340 [Pleurotus pulmonarius]